MTTYLGVTGHPATLLRGLSLLPAEGWETDGPGPKLVAKLIELAPGQKDAIENAVAIIIMTAP
jgi:hypothetical protein